jgi:phage shock protein E
MSWFTAVRAALCRRRAVLSRRQVLLVDVRTPAEFQRGHIDGAVPLPLDRLESEAPRTLPDRDAPIVVYCQSGMRSAQARRVLLGLGYRNVENGGGMRRLARRLSD